jgi:hypothetical protein
MTAGELAIRLLEDYGNEVNIETLIEAVQIIVKRDKDQYIVQSAEDGGPNELVIHCLDATVEHLGNASMAWYASTK